MNWTLLAVIVIIAVFAFIGLKRGIVSMLLSLLFSAVGIVAAIFITPAVTGFVRENTELDDAVRTRTMEYMEDAGFLMTADSEEVKEFFPEVFQKEINAEADKYIQEGVDAYNGYVVGAVANFILSAIVYLVVFLSIIIACCIVGAIVKVIAKLPIIRTANDLGGMIAGFGLGLLCVSLMFLILMVFSNFPWAKVVYEDIERSPILSILYNKNLILMIIAKIF